MSIEIQELNTFREFIELENEWNELVEDSYYNAPFVRHEWFRVWWQSFGDNDKLVVILARENGRLLFAMPLVEKHVSVMGKKFFILQSLTNSHSFRYTFVLRKSRDDVINDVWKYFQSRSQKWHLMILQEMPSDAVDYERLLNVASDNSHHTGVWIKGMSPYLPVEGDWEGFTKSLQKKFRQNLRRRRKKLAEFGEVDFTVARTRDQVPTVLPAGLAIEKKSWKGDNGSAIACSDRLVNFYTELANVAADRGWLRMSRLSVGGKDIAFDYGLEYANQRFCMKIAYDPEFHKNSPGQLLAADILQECYGNSINEVDFLGLETKQKLDWTKQSRKIVWLFIYNRTALASLHYLYKFQVKRRLKEAQENNPAMMSLQALKFIGK